MLRRTAIVGIALLATLAGTGAMAAPAHAWDVICPIGDECGGGGDPGTGPGVPPPAPAYTLQGVIQHEGEEHQGAWPLRQGRVKIRGYSRFANSSNDRVDANYINVRCSATVLGYTNNDYDAENNGALVDVHFKSPMVPVSGVPVQSRTVTVTCIHYAEKNGVSYDATSTAQFVISE
ncbi:hypothetical protein [Micromonospora peucetia]|uniref:Secreted protein n=1 Tax=Micromonospora peucetia TaxID=47871 RepID=A0A1C6VLP8_9ACTN|nr:hypothetical protein [Micromonospora peucetia]WSA30567.1 hypothetical protein OIE14_20570 [Micromonospora peucetia]SCL67167.1 hypothetical protein GA0070608_3449 [Micromonospora peucetia]